MLFYYLRKMAILSKLGRKYCSTMMIILKEDDYY